MFLYWQKKPDVTLRPYVKNYWHFRRNFDKRTSHVIYPDSYYELIWVKEGKLYINGIEAPELFFSGFNEAKITLTGDGKIEIFGVRFYAWGCVPFTDMAFSKADLFKSSNEFLDSSSLDFLNSLIHQEGMNFYEMLDNFLISLMTLRQINKNSKKLNKYLLDSQNFSSMRALIKASGLSNRQLERQVRKSTGSTPKEILRRVRFENVRKALVDIKYHNLSELAHEYGYTDQSHLNKEFRRFTGMTPQEFRKDFQKINSHLKDSGKWIWD